MKASEIKGMRRDELDKKLVELQRQVFTLRSQAVTEKVENVRAVKNVRKDIARIKTVIRELELSEKKN